CPREGVLPVGIERVRQMDPRPAGDANGLRIARVQAADQAEVVVRQADARARLVWHWHALLTRTLSVVDLLGYRLLGTRPALMRSQNRLGHVCSPCVTCAGKACPRSWPPGAPPRWRRPQPGARE